MRTSIIRNAYHLDDIEVAIGASDRQRLSAGSVNADVSINRIDNEHASPERNEVLQNQAELIYYPEGGFAAWTVVLGAFCGLCGGVGTMNTMGAFQRHISQ